jgi:hypothetical protein
MPRLDRINKSGRAPMDYRPTTVHLTPSDDALLTTEAERMGVTRSAVVRLALRSWAMDGSESAPSRNASEKRSASDASGDQ